MTLYRCTICQHVKTSVTELHDHHVKYHTLQELSCTIINLQGFQCLNNFKHAKQRSLQLDDTNNNENLYDNVIVKTKGRNNSKCGRGRIIDSTIFYDEIHTSNHDKAQCLINCSKFLEWEHEFNKRTEISDDDFFNIIENFCNDLNNRRHRGRKRKNEAKTDLVATTSCDHDCKNENMVEFKEETESMEGFNGFPPQTSVEMILPCKIENPVSDEANNDNIFTLEVKREENIENSDKTTLTIFEIDPSKQFLTYHSLDDSFRWSSIIAMDTDKREVFPNEGTDDSVLQEIHENSTKSVSITELN